MQAGIPDRRKSRIPHQTGQLRSHRRLKLRTTLALAHVTRRKEFLLVSQASLRGLERKRLPIIHASSQHSNRLVQPLRSYLRRTIIGNAAQSGSSFTHLVSIPRRRRTHRRRCRQSHGYGSNPYCGDGYPERNFGQYYLENWENGSEISQHIWQAFPTLHSVLIPSLRDLNPMPDIEIDSTLGTERTQLRIEVARANSARTRTWPQRLQARLAELQRSRSTNRQHPENEEHADDTTSMPATASSETVGEVLMTPDSPRVIDPLEDESANWRQAEVVYLTSSEMAERDAVRRDGPAATTRETSVEATRRLNENVSSVQERAAHHWKDSDNA